MLKICILKTFLANSFVLVFVFAAFILTIPTICNKMSQNDSAPCGLSGCDKNVTNKSGGICCSRCQSWYYLGCAKVTTEEANFLSKMKRKFIFECSDCSSSSSEVADLRNEVRCSNNSIQNKLDALLSKVGNYDTQMKKLKDEINTCNSRIIEVDNTVSLKIKTLENKNEILQKRFNKLDIIKRKTKG